MMMYFYDANKSVCPQRGFELDFISLLSLSSLSLVFDVTHTESLSLSLSVLYSPPPPLETTRRQHCELGAWVKVESGETQKWFGRVRELCFVFGSILMRCHQVVNRDHHHHQFENIYEFDDG